jgi:hypothetical protein
MCAKRVCIAGESEWSFGMTRKTIHLTEEALTRRALPAFTTNAVTVRVVRGYGLELVLYDGMAPSARVTVTYRDLHPARDVSLKHPLQALAYTLRRRADVSEPFDIEITYEEANVPDAGT